MNQTSHISPNPNLPGGATFRRCALQVNPLSYGKYRGKVDADLEDDLDNRFITESVVPRMREEKRNRQFVFSAHNANIPVLGDAEMILDMRASGEAAQSRGRGRVPIQHTDSIDAPKVREVVEELLEGGRDAFERRHHGFER